MMGNCHVPFLGEEREAILVEPVALAKTGSRQAQPYPTNRRIDPEK